MAWPTENEAAYLHWLNERSGGLDVGWDHTIAGGKLDERHQNLEREGLIEMRWADGGANIVVRITPKGRHLIDPRSRPTETPTSQSDAKRSEPVAPQPWDTDQKDPS